MRRQVMSGVLFVVLGAAITTGGCSGADANVDSSGAAQTADGFTEAEWALVKTLSPLPEKPPPDPTNKWCDDARAAKLGQRFFWEKRIAGPIKVGPKTNADGTSNGALGAVGETGKIACVDCHMPSSGWLFDVRSNNGNGVTANATSLGTDWGVRNVSSVINTAYYIQKGGPNAQRWRENDGYADSAWADAQSEPEGPEIQNGSRLQLAHLIYDHYKADYEEIFREFPLPPLGDTARFPLTGRPGQKAWDNMPAADQDAVNRVFMNYGKTIEAYVRLLLSRNAPFDAFVAGKADAISDAAKRGLKLFVGEAGCIGCHNTPLFSDDDFHVTGLKVNTARSPHADPTETGRASTLRGVLDSPFNVNGVYSDDRHTGRLDGVHATTADKGKWRTKALRQVGPTAPYMHDGEFATLEEVIDFYDRGGDASGYIGTKEIKPLHLSATQKSDLKAFLLTLTGEPVRAELLVDTHRP
jgi:cytochrome c peroxidase